jgi:hypothetical protein
MARAVEDSKSGQTSSNVNNSETRRTFLAVVAVPRINDLRAVNVVISSTPHLHHSSLLFSMYYGRAK